MESFVLKGKRKRKAVSYVQDDAELENLIAAAEQSNVDISSGSDVEYGDNGKGRKRQKKTKRKSKSASKSRKKPEKTFNFMGLPRELRDEIYKQALADSNLCLTTKMRKSRYGVIRIAKVPSSINHTTQATSNSSSLDVDTDATVGFHGKTKLKPVTLVPALLAVSKQINEEGSNVLYGQTLNLDDMRTMTIFLANIGPSNVRLLRSITIRTCDATVYGTYKTFGFSAFALLATCTDLRSVTIACKLSNTSHGWPHGIASMVYRDCQTFIKAYGQAHGRADAALDILHIGNCNFENRTSYYHPRPTPTAAELDKRHEEYKKELHRLVTT